LFYKWAKIFELFESKDKRSCLKEVT